MLGCALPIKAPPEVKDLVKSDTAFFVEAVRSELDQSLGHLLVKLYRRNPIQLPATSSIETRVAQLKVPKLDLQEFGGPKPDDLVRMAFHEDFTGDRVYAFVAGLQSMVNHVFDHRREYLLLDDLPLAQFVFTIQPETSRPQRTYSGPSAIVPESHTYTRMVFRTVFSMHRIHN